MALTTIDDAEVAKFEAMAARWWDPQGDAAPLHRMNPCRLDYITRQIAAPNGRDLSGPRPFAELALADVGCGGGLASEPMARLGATVTGLDAAEAAVAVARDHAARAGLRIDYRAQTVEALVAEAPGRFDVVLALEIVEHVADMGAFLAAVATLAKPGGLVIASTLNRTPASFAKAIVGAELLLRWLPRGTHDWRRFPTPDELAAAMTRAGLTPVDRCGMVYAPLSASWRLDARDLSTNYLMTAEKPA
jgi:2-polyprenyl-6-hydroxyphenyl methylase/3-demethylubiquinone-9 3-methyltransferase